MNADRKSILVHCRRAPYGSSLAREAIDLALAAAAFDQPVAVLFSGEGVWQLLPDQQPESLGARNQAGLLRSLPLYEVDRLFAAGADLQQRGLEPGALAVPVTVLDDRQLRALIADVDQVFSF